MTGPQATRTEETHTACASGARGTYVLLAQLDREVSLEVGRLGQVTFPRGWYLYVGSALGPGGLAARLARHRRSDKRLHWHIDYLLVRAALVGDWHVRSPIRLECAWADALRSLADASLPAPGFGASDCRCEAHLMHLAHCPADTEMQAALTAASPTGCIIHHARYVVSTGR